jgi:LmbE family N-acetylglucosaminyl deacetylase
VTGVPEQAGVADPDGNPIRRILAFAAHPDDVDFGAAGTVAKFTAAGVRVTYCIMTDGDAGGFDEAHRIQMVELRHAEQRQAAALVGVEEVTFLGQPDGFLEASQQVIGRVVELIRRDKPDVVLSMHPERNWDRIQSSHPDHLACGEAVTRAVYPAAENPYAFPELAEAGLGAYRLPWLWFYGGPVRHENHFVDITGHVEDKLRAIRMHVTQHPDVGQMDARVRAQLEVIAQRAGLPAGRSAEAFHVVPVNTAQTIAGF